jgi:hypothetical protein
MMTHAVMVHKQQWRTWMDEKKRGTRMIRKEKVRQQKQQQCKNQKGIIGHCKIKNTGEQNRNGFALSMIQSSS